MKKYDLIVIGGGAGGLTAAAGAASLGGKVALIEKEAQPGGDCLHYGCVPSKTLIELADAIYQSRGLGEYGLETVGQVSLGAVMKRVENAIAHIQVHDDADRFRKLGVEVYRGQGRFQSAHEVEVGDEEVIYGKRIVLATGSRPHVPDVPGLKEAGFWTNETLFQQTELPGRLLVMGGGPLGLELAQAMARLGSDVTVVERSEGILAKEDKTVITKMKELLEKELTIYTGASVKRIARNGSGKVVSISLDKSGEDQLGKPAQVEVEVEVDAILLAAGRRPNSHSLQLEKAGVKVTEHGHIKVNGRLQTNVSHIYAIGDVNGELPFTHVAGMEGKHVVQTALLGLRRNIDYSNVPWVTYTSPEVFHLGLTEQEAREKGLSYKVFEVPLSEVDRFVTDGAMDGFIKVLTDKKGKILGAHAVGKHAGDWMQEVVATRQFRKRLGSLSSVIHPYPNHSAAVQRAADSYWRERLFEGVVPRLVGRYVKWFR